MSEWSAGYVSDVGYTFGYYPELNPLRTRLAFLNHGLVYPEVKTACELGFGQGISVNIHSATSEIAWYGTDFNPSQAGFAREMAAASESGVELQDDDFASYLLREDLPEFDFIGMHGIWSWVSDQNRKLIVDFIQRKLKVGGVLYLSYNTLAGWASFVPLRHLMTQHADAISAGGAGTLDRVTDAVAFASRLVQSSPLPAKVYPQMVERLEKLKEQNPYYLAHEYFNRDWHPEHFSALASTLESAKLQYACSAHYLDHVDALNLEKNQQEFLGEIKDVTLRESVRDFMVNQLFRRDYWVKGVRRLSQIEQAERFREQKLMLVLPVEDVKLKVPAALGEAQLNESIYTPILTYLADYKIRTIGQIEQAVKELKIPFVQVIQVVMVLAGAGYLRPTQEDAIVAKSRKAADKLNKHVLNLARGNSDIAVLASPVIGGGISVTRYQQLFLLALLQKKSTAKELASFTWMVLQMQGQKLVKEGVPIEAEADNLAELEVHASRFLDKNIPALKALQII